MKATSIVTLLWSDVIAAHVCMIVPSEQMVRGLSEKLLQAILILQFQESGEGSPLDLNQYPWSNSPSHNPGEGSEPHNTEMVHPDASTECQCFSKPARYAQAVS
jgi:hypothetical protein